MSYQTICNEIYDKVKLNSALNATFNYNVKSYEKYPTAVITPTDGGETIFQSCSNIGDYNITVRVVDRNVDEDTMEPRMRILCDDLITDIRSMPLGNGFDKIQVKVSWGWTDDEEPLRVFEIICICNKIKPI